MCSDTESVEFAPVFPRQLLNDSLTSYFQLIVFDILDPHVVVGPCHGGSMLVVMVDLENLRSDHLRLRSLDSRTPHLERCHLGHRRQYRCAT